MPGFDKLENEDKEELKKSLGSETHGYVEVNKYLNVLEFTKADNLTILGKNVRLMKIMKMLK